MVARVLTKCYTNLYQPSPLEIDLITVYYHIFC